MEHCGLCGKKKENLTKYTVYTEHVEVHDTYSGSGFSYSYKDKREHNYGVCNFCTIKWDWVVPPLVFLAASLPVLAVAFAWYSWRDSFGGCAMLAVLNALIIIVILMKHYGFGISGKLERNAIESRKHEKPAGYRAHYRAQVRKITDD